MNRREERTATIHVGGKFNNFAGAGIVICHESRKRIGGGGERRTERRVTQ